MLAPFSNVVNAPPARERHAAGDAINRFERNGASAATRFGKLGARREATSCMAWTNEWS
ncbi:hypothetical protein GCM10022214_31660 [Actinomadura miaoliensis]|uniref:Uncharacterized protein n=1 Tax=Actinomadura miaoliensis TaxID=430685 RepID=A0ABP7VRL3_9ACTN